LIDLKTCVYKKITDGLGCEPVAVLGMNGFACSEMWKKVRFRDVSGSTVSIRIMFSRPYPLQFAGSDLPARARAMLVLTEFAKLLRSLRMGVLFAAV
jgi:hypothetical protein